MHTDRLTPRERMKALIEKRELDRIPVMPHAQLYTAAISGISFREFQTIPEKAYKARCYAAELHGYDDFPSYSYASWSDWAGWDFGGEIFFPEKDTDFPFVSKRPVEKLEDVEKLKIPDPVTAPVMRQRIECARMNRKIGRKAAIQATPTGMASSILGREKLMRWYIKEPDAAHAVLGKATDYILRTADFFIKAFGAENCCIHEGFPLDSNQLISPRIFEEFGAIYVKKIHEDLMAKGITSWSEIHLCGDHMNNLPCWQDIPLAPRSIISIGSEMDIKTTADFFGEEHIIAGNVSTSLLFNGTPEEIMEHCNDIIRRVKDHPGGFILCPACLLPPMTPPVNVHAMVKAARIYGQY